MKESVWWVAEKCMRARTIILVEARSKKEAQAKVDKGECEGIYTEHYNDGRAKVLRRDKKS